ncbi:zinc finger and BTB domain-containing 17-like protein [Labeo rohita]|uniref:Zinc finger and BTB domain-containing 17-like protein n=1 Tax=Labeo rohita TaxID=84645 RepID=A0A498P4C6_LABRO|nr:zinc finger and BTB domain-containing 17-like protein [Labeo rohita]
MTKLDRLNTFMTERLMAAVKEIIITVGRTVREYEEETERIRSENKRLKEMLRDSGCFNEQTNAADSKMTKLQVINTFLTERLMATLNEIMDMIGGTVLQYEKELDSVQKDNEYLRRRLKEIEKLVESNGTLTLLRK